MTDDITHSRDSFGGLEDFIEKPKPKTVISDKADSDNRNSNSGFLSSQIVQPIMFFEIDADEGLLVDQHSIRSFYRKGDKLTFFTADFLVVAEGRPEDLRELVKHLHRRAVDHIAVGKHGVTRINVYAGEDRIIA